MDENGIKYQQIAGQEIKGRAVMRSRLLEGSHGYSGQDVKSLLRHLSVQLIRSD